MHPVDVALGIWSDIKAKSNPLIIFRPIINFIFVIISKLWFKCLVFQFHIIILYNCNLQQSLFQFLSDNDFFSHIRDKSQALKKTTLESISCIFISTLT